jgi:5-methylcytosine-specific restriction endonuclease McrA
MWAGSTSLPKGEATCRTCRQGGSGPRRASSSTKTCAVCATILVAGNLPQGKAMCTRCRQSTRDHLAPCLTCGAPSAGLRCKPCHVAVTRASATGKDLAARRALYRRRKARMAQAPGLTVHEMRNLRAVWIRQRRPCSYCPALADTVDHVIPLALGGTNHEGNLAPACRSCNSRKNDSLLIEWKRKLIRGAGARRAA